MNKFFIAYNNKEKCTGCGACYQICPNQAISMKYDKEGFLYPLLDENLCINCGLCEKVCPEIHKVRTQPLGNICYSATHKDVEVLKNSSSGGAFTAIVQALGDDCVVYGVAYDEHLKVIHTSFEGIKNIDKFRSTKYVQSDTKNTYKEVRDKLKINKKIVLFTGTPCQIAGLKSFLGKDFKNLYCVEILCHGVASPGVFNKYINKLSKKYNDKVINFQFRTKKKWFWMWEKFLTSITFSSKSKKITLYDSFTLAFLKRLILRPVCEHCIYANKNRVGDIVIGDFWGIETIDKSLYTNRGVSLCLPITDKGKHIMKLMSTYMNIKEFKTVDVLALNKPLYTVTKHHSRRNEFFSNYLNIGIVNSINSIIHQPSGIKKIFGYLPNSIKKVIHKFI